MVAYREELIIATANTAFRLTLFTFLRISLETTPVAVITSYTKSLVDFLAFLAIALILAKSGLGRDSSTSDIIADTSTLSIAFTMDSSFSRTSFTLIKSPHEETILMSFLFSILVMFSLNPLLMTFNSSKTASITFLTLADALLYVSDVFSDASATNC